MCDQGMGLTGDQWVTKKQNGWQCTNRTIDLRPRSRGQPWREVASITITCEKHLNEFLVNSWFWTDVILSFLLQSIDNMIVKTFIERFCLSWHLFEFVAKYNKHIRHPSYHVKNVQKLCLNSFHIKNYHHQQIVGQKEIMARFYCLY